jgi:hypothetical protein
MMNPDQMYALRQLQHGDLRAEAERGRVTRELVGNRRAWDDTWLPMWLHRLGIRRTSTTAVTDQAGTGASTRTA